MLREKIKNSNMMNIDNKKYKQIQLSSKCVCVCVERERVLVVLMWGTVRRRVRLIWRDTEELEGFVFLVRLRREKNNCPRDQQQGSAPTPGRHCCH
jgi:hypothetical protein